MAEPAADRFDVDEAQKALCGLVIAGRVTTGILELIEAPLDQVAQPVERTVDADGVLRDFSIGLTSKTSRLCMDFRMLSAS